MREEGAIGYDRASVRSLLFQHWVGTRQVAVSRFASPMSVRDQIIRSVVLARELVSSGVIRPVSQTGTVVTIGAGVAGLAFAEELVYRCPDAAFEVIVVEREGQPLSRQLNAHHRSLEPTLYDWPASHWGQDRFPLDHMPGCRFQYAPGLAHDVASSWIKELASTDKVKFICSAIAEPARKASATGHRLVTVYNALLGDKGVVKGHLLHEITDCILVCHAWGIGRERLFPTDAGGKRVGNFSSFGFWQEENYSNLSSGSRVLISGGGDGAIQDLLRLATGLNSPGELMKRLWPDSTSSPSWRSILDQTGLYLAGLVDDAERAWLTGSQELSRSFWQRLETAITQLFDMKSNWAPAPEVWRSTWKRWPQIKENARDLWKRSGSYSIVAAHREETYEHCYPLNRFTALLLQALLDTKITRLPGTSLGSIIGVEHHCSEDPQGCVGHTHSVESIDQRDLGHFKLIICRHGTLEDDQGNDDLIKRIRGLVPAGGWRQSLPFRIGMPRATSSA